MSSSRLCRDRRPPGRGPFGPSQSSGNRQERNVLFGNLDVLSRTFSARSTVLFDVALDLFEALNTPVALSCAIKLRYGELESLVRSKVDPSLYMDPFKFRDDYQAVSFLKKVPISIPGVDTEAAAKEKFLEAERMCKETNSRVRNFIRDPSLAPGPIRHIIVMAIGKIREVVGDRPCFREWLHSCRFGPGSFNHLGTKGLTSLYDKHLVRPSVTHDLRAIGSLLVMSRPQWARAITDSETEGFWPLVTEKDMDLVPGNRVAFVEKTAVTKRSIAIEPLVNIFAQLGLGACLRRRLKRIGQDLDDQSLNQEAARKGAIDGSLSTLDLSSASDTVAKELVRLLLPDGWFRLLDLTRSKVGELDGEWLRYEKFSSMGNGFTFELESLIFWALSSSTCESLGLLGEIRAYGDDIVVPTPAYDLLVEVLTFCGFSVNPDKSFKSGPFRESCGKDYFLSTDVRPFFQKELPDGLETLFSLANGIRDLAWRRNNRYGCDLRLFRTWNAILREIPRPVAIHCRVPAHAGSGEGIKSNWDESQTSSFVISNKDGWEGVSGIRYQPYPSEGSPCSNMLGVVASLLYRLGDDGNWETRLMKLRIPASGSATPRQTRGCSYRLRRGAFWGPWTSYGGWI